MWSWLKRNQGTRNGSPILSSIWEVYQLRYTLSFQNGPAKASLWCAFHRSRQGGSVRPRTCLISQGKYRVELCCELRLSLPTLPLQSLLWKLLEWSKDKAYALVHQVLSLQRSKRSEKDGGHGRTSKRALKRSTPLSLSLTTFSLVQAKQFWGYS